MSAERFFVVVQQSDIAVLQRLAEISLKVGRAVVSGGWSLRTEVGAPCHLPLQQSESIVSS